MRISDWSSDVCSSDLELIGDDPRHHRREHDVGGAEIAEQKIAPAAETRARLGPDLHDPLQIAEHVVVGTFGLEDLADVHRMLAAQRREARMHLRGHRRSEEHTSELQSLMRISYAVFCLKKKKHIIVVKTK